MTGETNNIKPNNKKIKDILHCQSLVYALLDHLDDIVTEPLTGGVEQLELLDKKKEALFGGKGALPATLTALSELLLHLDDMEAAPAAMGEAPIAEAPLPFPEADVALARSYIERIKSLHASEAPL